MRFSPTFSRKTGELFHYAEWFIHYCLYVITQVFHFLIFLQTFERFIMYFTKSAENFVKISQQYLIRRSWILYIVFVMKDLILGIFWFLANVTVDIQKWYTHEIVYLVSGRLLMFQVICNVSRWFSYSQIFSPGLLRCYIFQYSSVLESYRS